MITIKNVKNMAGEIITATVESDDEQTIDAEGKLTILPAATDPHVHFRTPGSTHKEDFGTGAKAAVNGGVTRVFDMPNTSPLCTSKEALEEKKRLIDKQLSEAGIPLRYHLYFGATKDNLDEIAKVQHDIVGVKVFMGSSTGKLLLDDDTALDTLFMICAQLDIIISVHAEDDSMLKANTEKYKNSTDPAIHSVIRDRSAAIAATKKAIGFAEKYSTRLAILHVSTKEEVELIRDAKANSLLVYGEAAPHHLFLTQDDYKEWGTKVQMNPPLRTHEDQLALWEGILDNTIDFIGSDHAPHTLEEKNQPYGQAPSGVPGVETTLPLLFNAYNEKKITLKQIVDITRKNIETIFNLRHNDDAILVDLDLEKTLDDSDLKTKCGWSPYSGRTLKGWPVTTILRGKVFHHA